MCSIILILSDDFFVATPSNNQDRVNYSAVKKWRGLKQYLAVVARVYKGLIVAQKSRDRTPTSLAKSGNLWKWDQQCNQWKRCNFDYDQTSIWITYFASNSRVESLLNCIIRAKINNAPFHRVHRWHPPQIWQVLMEEKSPRVGLLPLSFWQTHFKFFETWARVTVSEIIVRTSYLSTYILQKPPSLPPRNTQPLILVYRNSISKLTTEKERNFSS